MHFSPSLWVTHVLTCISNYKEETAINMRRCQTNVLSAFVSKQLIRCYPWIVQFCILKPCKYKNMKSDNFPYQQFKCLSTDLNQERSITSSLPDKYRTRCWPSHKQNPFHSIVEAVNWRSVTIRKGFQEWFLLDCWNMLYICCSVVLS